MIHFALLLILAQLAAAPQTTTPLQILDVGLYGAAQLPTPLLTSDWIALCPSGAAADLRLTQIRARPFFDEVGYDKPGQQSGRDVQATACPTPHLLLRGPAFSPGPVASALLQPSGFVWRGTRYRLDNASDPRRLWLRYGTRRVLLLRSDTDLEFRLRWAGDLDRDGALDLVLEEKYDATLVHLFLSRHKRKSKTWEPALTTFHGGC